MSSSSASPRHPQQPGEQPPQGSRTPPAQRLARSNIQRPSSSSIRRSRGRYALEFEGVKKGYDTDKDGKGGRHEVIKGFSAMVQRGEKVALMGRNGIGKTTLLNALLANAPRSPSWA